MNTVQSYYTDCRTCSFDSRIQNQLFTRVRFYIYKCHPDYPCILPLALKITPVWGNAIKNYQNPQTRLFVTIFITVKPTMTKVFKTTYKPTNITRNVLMGQIPHQGYFKWDKYMYYFDKYKRKDIHQCLCHSFSLNARQCYSFWITAWIVN